MAVYFGTVTRAAPLQITTDQKLILEAVHLILTDWVRDLELEMYVDHETESASHEHSVTGSAAAVEHGHPVAGTAAPAGTIDEHDHSVTGSAESVSHGHSVTGTAQPASHSHRYKGWKTFILRRGLAEGDRVILLRCDGGQKYLVLGRWKEGA